MKFSKFSINCEISAIFHKLMLKMLIVRNSVSDAYNVAPNSYTELASNRKNAVAETNICTSQNRMNRFFPLYEMVSFDGRGYWPRICWNFLTDRNNLILVFVPVASAILLVIDIPTD